MKIVVTGGAGFVGSHIVDDLVAHGHEVTVIDRADRPAHTPMQVRYIRADIAEEMPSLAGQDAVIHAAAHADISRNWESFDERLTLYRDNVVATMHVLEEAIVVGCTVIFVSSAAVTWDAGGSPYAASKAFGENLVRAYCNGKQPYGIARLVSCVGSRYSHGHIADFVDQAKAKGHISALDNGLSPKSFVHVKDAAQTIARGAASVLTPMSLPFVKQTIHIAGTPWSWRDTAAMMGVPALHYRQEVEGWRGDPVGLQVVSDIRPSHSVGEGVREALVSLGWFR